MTPDEAHYCAYPMYGVSESTDMSYVYDRKAGAALGGPYEAADCSVVDVYSDHRTVNCPEVVDGRSMGYASGDTAMKDMKSELPCVRVVWTGTDTV